MTAAERQARQRAKKLAANGPPPHAIVRAWIRLDPVERVKIWLELTSRLKAGNK